MPDIGGLKALRRLKAIDTAARVLAFSMYDNEAMILRMLEAGATGYLTKVCGMGQMVEAVRKVAKGKPFDSLHVSDLVGNAIAGMLTNPLQALSACEFLLFQQLADGQSALEISRMLSISPKNVAVHHADIMR